MRKEPVLYLTAFVGDGSMALVGLSTPLLAMRLGATYDELGAIGGVGALVYALGCLVSGRLADRAGYRLCTAAASLAVALVCLSYLGAARVAHLFVLSALMGAASTALWPPMQAWLSRGKDRSQLLRAVGGFNVSFSLGLMVGPALGGFLYAANPDWPFAVSAGLMGCVFLGLAVMRVGESAPAEKDDPKPEPVTGPPHFVPIVWAANFATFFATAAIRTLFPKLATDLGIEPGTLGQLMSLIALAQLVAFICISRTDRWQFRLGPLAATQVLGLAALLGLVLGQSPGIFAVALLLHGVVIGVTFTYSIFHSLYATERPGQRTGYHEAVVGIGFFLGPLLGGLAAEHIGSRAPYAGCAGLVACSLVVQVCLLRRGRSG